MAIARLIVATLRARGLSSRTRIGDAHILGGDKSRTFRCAPCLCDNAEGAVAGINNMGAVDRRGNGFLEQGVHFGCCVAIRGA
mgnify:CR=1 FL=1